MDVDRLTVVTAGHCVADHVASDLTFRYKPEQGGGFSTGVESVAVHPSFMALWAIGITQKETDVAVLRLRDPIPESVVSEPARLYLGDAESALDEHRMTLPATVVGFGEAVFDPNDEYVGTSGVRRVGNLAGVSLRKDSCDFLEQNHCNDEREWERDYHPDIEAAIGSGDSGGPLFLNVLDRDGEYKQMVVGVTSGWYYDYFRESDDMYSYTAVWAAFGVGSNASWLAAALGGDQDADGVLDIEDNCSPQRCLSRNEAGWDLNDCWNPPNSDGIQPDGDGDGVGDACDNCAPAECVSLGRNVAQCFNPSQRNADGDQWGDICDLCPHSQGATHGISAIQNDADADGVGDQCDNCQKCADCDNTINGYRSCIGVGHGDCPQLAGMEVVCIAEEIPGSPGYFPTGHCSRQLDESGDEDGIGGQCDTCPDMATPKEDETNSNGYAERREKADRKGDVCDPVLVARFEAQSATEIPDVLQLTQGDGTDPDDVAELRGFTWLGRESRTEPVSPKLIDEPVTFRQCDCWDPTLGELSLAECVRENGRCDWTRPDLDAAELRWKGLRLRDPAPGTGVYPPGSNTPTMLFRSWETQTSQVEHYQFLWDWYSDTQRPGGVVARRQDESKPWSATSNPWTTYGAVFSHVQNTTATYASTRDSSKNLRDSFALVSTPMFTRTSAVDDGPTDVDKLACMFDGCSSWVHPELWAVDPSPVDLISRFKDPALLIKEGARILAYRAPGEILDVTRDVSDSLAELLGSRNSTLWLAPAEPAYRVRHHGLPVQSVVLPVNLDQQTTTPTVVMARGGGLGTEMREVVGRQAIPGLIRPSSGPALLQNVRGVFSAIEEVVYVVGGTNETGPAGTIWRYHVPTRRWTLAFSGASLAPSGNVLSVTYDQRNSTLYVLDVDDEAIAPGKKAIHLARLQAYDSASGTARLVATWPYVKLFDKVSITAADDGHVILLGAKRNTWMAWRLDARTGNAIHSRGVLTGLGTVLDRPIMGEEYPTLPVLRSKKITYVSFFPSAFHGGAGCSSL